MVLVLKTRVGYPDRRFESFLVRIVEVEVVVEGVGDKR
jgi:hypothetical protein